MTSKDVPNWIEYGKYVYQFRTKPELGYCLMNLELFNSLPAEDQQIIQRAANTAIDFLLEDVRSKEAYWEEEGRKVGVEVIYPTPEQLAVFASGRSEDENGLYSALML